MRGYCEPPLHRLRPLLGGQFFTNRPGSEALSQVIEAPAELVIISGFEVKVPARHNP
jgi:hypothetical protein